MSKAKKKKSIAASAAKKAKAKQSALKLPVFSQNAGYIVLAFTLLFVLFVRINLLDLPIERDEGGFAYIGKMAMEGQLLYTDLHDLKLPGLYYTYGLFIQLFGYSASGIHSMLLLFNLGAILLLFFFFRAYFDVLTGALAAAAYAILSLSPNVFGFAAHATQLLIVPGFAGLWLLIRAFQSGKLLSFFLAGLLFGYAFTIKQQAVYFMLLAGIFLLFVRLREKPVDWKVLIPEMGILIVGSVLPYLLIVCYMLLQDRFADLWFWTFEYPRAEGVDKTLEQSWGLLNMMSGMVWRGQYGLWLLAGLGWLSVFFANWSREQKFLALALPLFMFGGVATGFHFYPHYFVMLLPAIALLSALFVRNALHWLAAKNLALLGALPVLLFIGAWSQIIQNRTDYFFNPDYEQIIRSTYGKNPFLESKVIGEHLRSISQPGDQIAVFGSEPQLMMYAERASVGGHLFIYPLTDGRAYSERLQEQMMRAIQEEKPRFAVYANFRTSWLPRDPDAKFYKKMDAELKANYQVIGVADSSEPETLYRFGDQLRNFQPGNENLLWLFQRK